MGNSSSSLASTNRLYQRSPMNVFAHSSSPASSPTSPTSSFLDDSSDSFMYLSNKYPPRPTSHCSWKNCNTSCVECANAEKPAHQLARISNDCPICMEKLVSVFNHKIGTTVPCGHCFHWDCFQECKSWKLNICPICTKPITDFIRIYMTSDFNDENIDIKGEAIDTLKISLAENDDLKREKRELERKLKVMKDTAEAQKQLVNQIPKAMKDLGINIQRFGNGIHYICYCIKKGCIRRDDEQWLRRNNNQLILIGSSVEDDSEDNTDDEDISVDNSRISLESTESWSPANLIPYHEFENENEERADSPHPFSRLTLSHIPRLDSHHESLQPDSRSYSSSTVLVMEDV